MTIRKIATIGHPVLRQKARPLTQSELASKDTQRFIDDLIETMVDANGAGIAANQVYEPIRICTIWVKDNPRYPYKPNVPLTVLVNPEIEIVPGDTFVNYEGCLSVPNLRGEVKRHAHIRVKAWDREGKAIEREVKGLTAGTYQHEVDHLDGTLFVDRVFDTKSLCTWEQFERNHLKDFAERAKGIVAKYGS
jgi:peptide deformylase